MAEQRELTIPVAHHDGNFFADEETLNRIEGEGQVAFRYGANPNGSSRDIAGVANAAGNVLGMMPHPERAVDANHGGTDGVKLFESVLGAALSDAEPRGHRSALKGRSISAMISSSRSLALRWSSSVLYA